MAATSDATTSGVIGREVGGDDRHQLMVTQGLERSQEAAERPLARVQVGHDVEADGGEGGRVAADRHHGVGSGGAQGVGGQGGHGPAVDRQERLVAPHPPAPTARQHRPRERPRRRRQPGGHAPQPP